jgi:hypothetical protein
VIRRLAAQGPVVIAIDDIQWLDRPSAMTLDYALRRLGSEPVGLLASARAGAGGDVTSPAGAGLAAGHLGHLRIGPLAPADFEAAIWAAAGSRLSRLIVRRLFEASGGNPLYGRELARVLGRLDSEPLPGEPLPVPGGLQGVLSARIAALPPEVQDVLLAASCLRAPTASALERAGGPRAWAAVQSAADEGVVEVEGSRVRFTHPLFASAIYSGAAARRRREVHRKLSLIAANAEERARHQALSVEGPDEEAGAALARAAQAAAARGAPGAAAELAELAVARTPAELAPVRRHRRLDAAEFLYRAGDTIRARHAVEAVAQDMPSGGERAEALLALARVLLHDAGDLVAVPVLEEALAEASTDRILQARIHISLARTCGGDLRYSARHAGAGLALAQQAGDQGLVRQALAEKLYADFNLGRDLPLELDDDRLLGPEPEREPSAVEERASTILGLCLVRADRFDEARGLLGRALRAAQEEGDDSSLPLLLAHLSDLECWAGNWQAAEHYAAQSQEVAGQVEHRAWRGGNNYAPALIDAHLGRLDVARAEAADGLSAATAAGDDWAVMMLHGVLGFTELSAGNLTAAEASLSTAAGLADQIGLAEPATWRFHANHVEVVVGLGELDRAERLLTWLERRGRATERRWTLATAARCRALLLAARGDTQGALQALGEALRHHQQLAMPFEMGRTLLAAGQPAAGTGRILIPLLEAGHEVEGLDSSPQMLTLCRQHCHDRGLDPPLREADMTVHVRLAAFHAVIIPAGSIALLDGRKATLQALTCFRDSLIPGGHLFVDVPVPRPEADPQAMRYWWRGSYLWTLQTMHTEYHPVANQTTRFLRYDKWQDGALHTTELQIFRMQHWSSQDFGELLAEAGFTGIGMTADYQDARTSTTASDVWTFHATATHAASRQSALVVQRQLR